MALVAEHLEALDHQVDQRSAKKSFEMASGKIMKQDEYWTWCQKGEIPPGPKGKWLIFVSPKWVDKFWRDIVKAINSGKLGGLAKVSTQYNNMINKTNYHVICVYASVEEEEAMRVGFELRSMGFGNKTPLRFKPDSATLQNQYGKDTAIYMIPVNGPSDPIASKTSSSTGPSIRI